jgi:hypothetical protein
MSHLPKTSHEEEATLNAELRWALSSQSANVLIIGAGETAVPTIQAYIAPPLTVIAEDVPPDLEGNCLVRDALLLTREHQHALLKRLDRRPDLRLVTFSAVPVYPLVQLGNFDETLYYRLNTIMVEWPGMRDERSSSPRP